MSIHVHMLSGSEAYQSAATLTVLRGYLETRGITSTLSLAQEKGTDLPNLEPMEKADVLLVFTQRMALADAPLRRIKQWCRLGKPITTRR